MERGRGGKGKRGRSEQEEAKEEPEAELCHLVRTLQQPTERGTRRMLLRRTRPHVGSSSQVGMLFVVLDVWKKPCCNRIKAFISSMYLCVCAGNRSPQAGRAERAERERKVAMRLHRGAPANVSSSDLTARLDQSRITASQVGELRLYGFREGSGCMFYAHRLLQLKVSSINETHSY